MKHHSLLLAVGMSLLFVAPVSAQNRRNEVVPIKKNRRIAVDDWSPKQGAVGTEVTIRGKGFGPRVEVLFGGRRVRGVDVRPGTLTFRVPKGYRDGSIVLRDRRGRRVHDIPVGNFTVIVPAEIARFAPQSGIPGTRVEIVGSGFRADDQVLIGNTALRIERIKPRRIVAVVPRGARSDYLYVIGSDGARVRTTQRFEVLRPAPSIVEMQPSSGFPGTVVRISGQNFGPRAKVYYGRREVPVSGRGRGWIDIRIPSDARTSRWIFVRGRNGEARSPQKFSLDQPPIVSRIAPTSGSVGQRVTISGRNFRPGDRVSFNGVWADVEQIQGKRIIALVPQGAKSGPIVVPARQESTRRVVSGVPGALWATHSRLFTAHGPPGYRGYYYWAVLHSRCAGLLWPEATAHRRTAE